MVIDIAVPAERILERIGGKTHVFRLRRRIPHIHLSQGHLRKMRIAPLHKVTTDKPETVKNRIAVYERQTKPLIEYYTNRGNLSRVNGDDAPDNVYADVVAATERL